MPCQRPINSVANNERCGSMHASVETKDNQTVFAQVEIEASTLYRLIREKKLILEELHCMNTHSKNIIRQALLDSLTR
ncbi:MAG: hypothetical protein KUG83_01430 [Gammaproteobacteria bacterium]|nr:hypothetical protein [Gammaproteobacteria bacterium]